VRLMVETSFSMFSRSFQVVVTIDTPFKTITAHFHYVSIFA